MATALVQAGAGCGHKQEWQWKQEKWMDVGMKESEELPFPEAKMPGMDPP